MNSSGSCGRGRGYKSASSSRSRQPQPGHSTSASGQRHDFSQRAARGHRQRPLSQRSPQHYPGQPRTPEQDDIDKAFSLLRTNPGRALAAAEVLLDRNAVPSLRCVSIYQLKARALLQLGKIDDCIAFINSLETRVRKNKGFLMTKARALQAKGRFSEALPLFQHLYVNHQRAYKDHKAHGLGLGRLLQLMGGADNLEKALAILTQLRARAAGGRAHSPCDDKDIELTLGRHLKIMGGADNLQQALAIFTRLRTQAAAGSTNTPCNDKDIELSLGRHLELMGGAGNLHKALAIYTRLRIRASGKVDTPCDDQDIELSLGRLLEVKGSKPDLKQALAIYTRLRSRLAGGRKNTPCNNKEIELALASLYIKRKNWPAFDELRLEARRFPGFEPHLCLSLRYWHELLEAGSISPTHSRLLGKAIRFAALAVEESGFTNASCISQLAHCLRLLSYWPNVLLQERGLQKKGMKGLGTATLFLFDTANTIAPGRQRLEKDQHWRAREQELLALLSRQQAAQGQH